MTYAEHLTPVAISTATWFGVELSSKTLSPLLVQNYSKLSTIKQHDWDSRIVGSLHAVIISILCVMEVQKHDPALEKDHLFGHNNEATLISIISTGYFIWDLVFCVRFFTPLAGIPFTLHAFCGAIGFFQTLYPYNQYYVVRTLLFELSTPFMHAHWFLAKTGYYGSTIQRVNGILGALVFFGVRIVYGCPLIYRLVSESIARRNDPRQHVALWTFQAGASCLMAVLSIMWFIMIVKMITKGSGGGNGSGSGSGSDSTTDGKKEMATLLEHEEDADKME
jgi:TLC domain